MTSIASMENQNTPVKADYFLLVGYITFLVSVVFSFRAISSISIGLILIAGIVRSRKANIFSPGKGFHFFLFGCAILYLVQCISLLYTNDMSQGLKLLQRSSGLVFIPLAVFTSRDFLTSKKSRKLVFIFALALSVAALYCLAHSIFDYVFYDAPVSIFFYHALVKPISQHAIQFSILIFCALLSLFEDSKKNEFRSANSLRRFMMIFLSLFLILLSSKLVISFYIFYLLLFFFGKQIFKVRSYFVSLCLVAVVAILMLTPNPVSNRFRAMVSGNPVLFMQKEFNPGVRFNGVQFRLLQWRFTYEILNEQHSWLSGLTPGDAQSFLDMKYAATKMYTGVAGTANHGFLGYHTHNQFLQALLENGLPALIVFLFICYSLYKMARESQRRELKWLTILLILYCFTDAPLATQYGLIIFTFLPSFFYSVQESPKQKHSSIKFNNPVKKENGTVLANAVLSRQPN